MPLCGLPPLGDPVSFPALPALCPVEWPGDGHPHLYLLDLVLDPLDGVAVDVVPGVHLLLTDHFGPDHCETQRHGGEQSPRGTFRRRGWGRGGGEEAGEGTPDSSRAWTPRKSGCGQRGDTESPGSRALQREPSVDRSQGGAAPAPGDRHSAAPGPNGALRPRNSSSLLSTVPVRWPGEPTSDWVASIPTTRLRMLASAPRALHPQPPGKRRFRPKAEGKGPSGLGLGSPASQRSILLHSSTVLKVSPENVLRMSLGKNTNSFRVTAEQGSERFNPKDIASGEVAFAWSPIRDRRREGRPHGKEDDCGPGCETMGRGRGQAEKAPECSPEPKVAPESGTQGSLRAIRPERGSAS